MKNDTLVPIAFLASLMLCAGSFTQSDSDDRASADEQEISEDMETLSTIVWENLSLNFHTQTDAAINYCPLMKSSSAVSRVVGEPLFDYLPGYGVSRQVTVKVVRH